METAVNLISAHLGICGSECVVHHHFFSDCMIGVCTTMPILLDATPLSKGDVKLGGAKLVGAHAFDVNCFMSLCTAKLILKSLKG